MITAAITRSLGDKQIFKGGGVDTTFAARRLDVWIHRGENFSKILVKRDWIGGPFRSTGCQLFAPRCTFWKEIAISFWTCWHWRQFPAWRHFLAIYRPSTAHPPRNEKRPNVVIQHIRKWRCTWRARFWLATYAWRNDSSFVRSQLAAGFYCRDFLPPVETREKVFSLNEARLQFCLLCIVGEFMRRERGLKRRFYQSLSCWRGEKGVYNAWSMPRMREKARF